MNTIQTSLFAVAIAICALCALLARKGTLGAQKWHTYFIAYLVVESLAFTLEWLTLHPATPAKSLWLGLLMGLSLLVAPCLWLFAREIAEGQAAPLRAVPIRHFLVVGAGIVLTIPLLLTAHSGPDYADPNNVASRLHSFFIHATMLACVILFLFQVPYYLKECARILSKHADHTKALFSNIEDKSLNTLRVLMFVVVTKWLVVLLRALYCLTLGKDTGWGVLFTGLEVSVTVWALFFVMRQSAVFSVDERKLVRDLFEAPAEEEGPAAAAKYSRSSLDGPARARIQRKLQDEMLTAQRFRDQRLTLRGLCQHMKESPHYVSQVINQDLDANFYDFVNSHRIESAKQALAAEPGKTVLEIALEVGFNSKSTFNAAFRRHTGMTPTEYRDSTSPIRTDWTPDPPAHT